MLICGGERVTGGFYPTDPSATLAAMPKALAKQGDSVVAIDTHVVMVATPSGPVPTPLPTPFRGPLSAQLSATVLIDEKPAATVDSKASNASPHVPQGGPFQTPPRNEASVQQGSPTILIDEKPAARHGDIAATCNDPVDAPVGKVIATGTVVTDD
jgi:uncharacterized Zn-binding protein involved in type VI secretion